MEDSIWFNEQPLRITRPILSLNPQITRKFILFTPFVALKCAVFPPILIPIRLSILLYFSFSSLWHTRIETDSFSLRLVSQWVSEWMYGWLSWSNQVSKYPNNLLGNCNQIWIFVLYCVSFIFSCLAGFSCFESVAIASDWVVDSWVIFILVTDWASACEADNEIVAFVEP